MPGCPSKGFENVNTYDAVAPSNHLQKMEKQFLTNLISHPTIVHHPLQNKSQDIINLTNDFPLSLEQSKERNSIYVCAVGQQRSLVADLFAMDYCLSPTAPKPGGGHERKASSPEGEHVDVIASLKTEEGDFEVDSHVKCIKEEPKDKEYLSCSNGNPEALDSNYDNASQLEKSPLMHDRPIKDTGMCNLAEESNGSESNATQEDSEDEDCLQQNSPKELNRVKSEPSESSTLGSDDESLLSIADLLPEQTSSKETDTGFKCEKCGKIFPRTCGLKRHDNRVHKRLKPHACPFCNKAFAENRCLQVHIRTHTGERPYQCEHCSHAFAQKQNLNKHIRCCHLNIPLRDPFRKPHKCEECGKRFHDKTHLQRHTMIHTGEKPYQCEVCGIPFKELYSLTRHMRCNRHKTKAKATVQGEKPYQCDVCNIKYRELHHLTRHLTCRRHKVKAERAMAEGQIQPHPDKPDTESEIRQIVDEVLEENGSDESVEIDLDQPGSPIIKKELELD
ncbi:zinc finger protein 420 isoform X2 [Nematostella vectensis]|uniref:zinc finger protein 420 isoform X2 n=1 Tax=Nematostella vectensis TaxID=45351 RepID=UPI0020778782|nr:zinc finger protein 420 isoform X2 [Nematostella vectensis]XP_048576651.1 zinc finger protein 420 isoform X2 [Nematostella vectensis]